MMSAAKNLLALSSRKDGLVAAAGDFLASAAASQKILLDYSAGVVQKGKWVDLQNFTIG